MRVFQTAAAAAALLLPATQAFPGQVDKKDPAEDPRFLQWAPPGPGDVRSPCPGLNALANHGFINRNGKNLNFRDVNRGSIAGLNMGVDFTAAIFSLGLLAAPNPLGGTFDLNDLDMHSFPIEHDVSLSRQDAYFGNDYSFNQTIFNQVLSAYDGVNASSIKVASKAKIRRFNDSKARNPELTYGLRETILSYGETALYMQTMNDTKSQAAPVEYFKMLFEQEKLPYELGWRRSPEPITLLSLGGAVLALFLESGETVPEGLTVLGGTYKDVLEAVGPIGNILRNETAILLRTVQGTVNLLACGKAKCD